MTAKPAKETITTTKFYMPQADWLLMYQFAQLSFDKYKSEVGGMAIMYKTENGYKIIDPVVLKQVVTGTTCSLDKDAIADYMSKSAIKYSAKLNIPVHEIRFVWWHSHAQMGVFWSGTDDIAIEEFSGGDWSLSIVVNCKNQYKARLELFDPIAQEVDVQVGFSEPAEIDPAIEKEFLKLVKPHTYTTKTTYGGYGYTSPRGNFRLDGLRYKTNIWEDIRVKLSKDETEEKKEEDIVKKNLETKVKSKEITPSEDQTSYQFLSTQLGINLDDHLKLPSTIKDTATSRNILCDLNRRFSTALNKLYLGINWEEYIDMINAAQKACNLLVKIPEFMIDKGKAEEFINKSLIEVQEAGIS